MTMLVLWFLIFFSFLIQELVIKLRSTNNLQINGIISVGTTGSLKLMKQLHIRDA